MTATGGPTTTTLELTGDQGSGKVSVLMEREANHRRWLGVLSIAGCDFHVDAIEVHPGTPTRARCAAMQSTVDAYSELDGNQAPHTVPIAGKPHLVLMYPFGD